MKNWLIIITGIFLFISCGTDDIEISELEYKDTNGSMLHCIQGTNEPYTGKAVRYFGGSLPDAIEEEQEFIDGLASGIWKKYFISGHLESEQSYNKGYLLQSIYYHHGHNKGKKKFMKEYYDNEDKVVITRYNLDGTISETETQRLSTGKVIEEKNIDTPPEQFSTHEGYENRVLELVSVTESDEGGMCAFIFKDSVDEEHIFIIGFGIDGDKILLGGLDNKSDSFIKKYGIASDNIEDVFSKAYGKMFYVYYDKGLQNPGQMKPEPDYMEFILEYEHKQ